MTLITQSCDFCHYVDSKGKRAKEFLIQHFLLIYCTPKLGARKGEVCQGRGLGKWQAERGEKPGGSFDDPPDLVLDALASGSNQSQAPEGSRE